MFPVGHDLSANVVITAFDCTGGEAAPIFTVWEPIQEETTVAFRSESHIGTIREGYGFGSWVPVGRLLPEVLIPPYRGTRDIQINVFLVRAHASPAPWAWCSIPGVERLGAGREGRVNAAIRRARSRRLGLHSVEALDRLGALALPPGIRRASMPVINRECDAAGDARSIHFSGL